MSARLIATVVALTAIIATPAIAQQRAHGRLRVINPGSASVRFEIRLAQGNDCEAGRMLVVRDLEPGQVWEISSSRPFCVRTDDGIVAGRLRWRQWQLRQPAVGGVEEVQP